VDLKGAYMSKQTIKEQVSECDEGILFADGFEEALIGVSTQFNRGPVALYDWDKCVELLMKRDGMDYDQAVEFMDFNVTGAWVGEKTPAFARLMTTEGSE
jgi:hypothetical protein